MDNNVDQILGSGTASSSSVDQILNNKQASSVDDILGNGDPWESFKSKASTIAQQRGFPLPVLLGQAALESARGTSNFAKKRNNYFGIGAFDSNPDQAYHYASPEENINAYINLVTSYPGVKEAIASGNPGAVIQAIESNGYASSPTYVQNVESTPEFKGGK